MPMSQKHIQQLDVFPPYRGGRTCVSNGYVWEFLPEHHLSNGWGWVPQHRVVAEDIAGRRLVQSSDWDIGEVAHHKDHCKTNNHPSNIEVMTKRAHSAHHWRAHWATEKARIQDRDVIEALTGRTIKQAAKILGCDHQTIRNRFPQLIEAHLRARPNRAEHLSTLEKIRPYAADPAVSMKEAGRLLHMNQRTVRKCCELHGLEWIGKRGPSRPRKATRPQAAQGASTPGPA